MSYDDFIARKELDTVPVGFECDESAHCAGGGPASPYSDETRTPQTLGARSCAPR